MIESYHIKNMNKMLKFRYNMHNRKTFNDDKIVFVALFVLL